MAGPPRASAGMAPGTAGRDSTGADGKGWRGPERIWPGRGPEPVAGKGLAEGAAGRPGAITAAGGMAGGAAGAAGGGAGGAGAGLPPTGGTIGRPASGGRMGAG
jgi:hypothetical protein